MIVLALALLVALAAGIGAAGPMAATEIRDGRRDLLGAKVGWAAEGELVRWFEDDWVDSAAATPGATVDFAPVGAGPVVVGRSLTRLADRVWLLEVVAVDRDQAGRPRAAARRGWLVGLTAPPSDSLAVPVLLSRFSVTGHR